MLLDVLLTATEAAAFVGVSYALIRQWIRRGKLHPDERGRILAREVVEVEQATRSTVKRRGGPKRTVLA